MNFGEDALSRDAFLDGRLRIRQPLKGYRAATDPVLLAASVPAQSAQSVLDLGCGAGVAALCLAARVPGLRLTGIEVQPDYAALARRNAVENRLDLEVIEGDLAALPRSLRNRSFDHVIANPPYHAKDKGSPATDAGRERALREETPLAVWIATAARRLSPKGYLSMIQTVERLPEMLVALSGCMSSLEIKPIAPRTGRAANRVLVRARKTGRAGFRLHAPLILHEGLVHDGDGENFTPAVQRILRDAVALTF